MCSLYLRLAAEESFVVLPGTLWWHFALRRLPDHAAAYCEAPPFRWWFASNKQLRNEHRRDHPKRCSHLWGGFWWKWSLAIHEKLHWRPHWSLGMVCCCIFLSDGILNDRWHFDVMRWQRGWSRKSGCKCGGVLVLDSWLLLAASLNLEGKIIHRSKQKLEEIVCLGFRSIMLIHTSTLLWHSCSLQRPQQRVLPEALTFFGSLPTTVGMGGSWFIGSIHLNIVPNCNIAGL